jgi:hypothetical protein
VFIFVSMALVAMVAGVFATIAQEEFPPAPRRGSVVPQEVKVVGIAGFVLGELYRHGSATVDQVNKWAESVGFTKRCILQLSVGLGGEGGLCLYMSRDNASVICCRENVGRIIKRIGAAECARWLAAEGLTEEEFATWFRSLPSIH